MFENLDFGQNRRKISILVKFFKNLDFVQNWWKISILIKIFVKFRIWSKFSKITIFVKIDEKSRFLSNLVELDRNSAMNPSSHKPSHLLPYKSSPTYPNSFWQVRALKYLKEGFQPGLRLGFEPKRSNEEAVTRTHLWKLIWRKSWWQR